MDWSALFSLFKSNRNWRSAERRMGNHYWPWRLSFCGVVNDKSYIIAYVAAV